MNAVANSTGFSHRVLTHSRIHHEEDPSGGVDDRNPPVVMAMNDQLLVGASVSGQVTELLAGLGIRRAVLGTLFEDVRLPDGTEPEVVQVFGLDLDAANGDRELDVFAVVRSLRGELGPEHERRVSPNHVLIPAPGWHSCPWDYPTPSQPVGNGEFEQPAGATVPVTVIDAGYLWSPWWDQVGAGLLAGGPLNPPPLDTQRNPLDLRGRVSVFGTQTSITGRGGRRPRLIGDWPGGYPRPKVDALEGHANFVAGVVAQLSPSAEIKIRTFNGGFPPDSDDIPTESMLIEAIKESVLVDQAEVINFGFSYVPLDGLPSRAWDDALALVGPDRIMTVPAGNQESEDEHYPAALKFPNVLGVASVEPDGGRGLKLSADFSNHGSWVKCSAFGRDVVSTFLDISGVVCEDDLTETPQNFERWARWSGTSFAAPKIAGRVAQAMADSIDGGNPLTAYEAWDQVVRPAGVVDQNNDVGVQFAF
jgi:hypothetical protein